MLGDAIIDPRKGTNLAIQVKALRVKKLFITKYINSQISVKIFNPIENRV
jgi:hypothetical protein